MCFIQVSGHVFYAGEGVRCLIKVSGQVFCKGESSRVFITSKSVSSHVFKWSRV